MPARDLPLSGIRVVEFCHVIMGPTCGMILGDLGADVQNLTTPMLQPWHYRLAPLLPTYKRTSDRWRSTEEPEGRNHAPLIGTALV